MSERRKSSELSLFLVVEEGNWCLLLSLLVMKSEISEGK